MEHKEETKKVEIKIRKLEKLETTADFNNRSWGFNGTSSTFTS